ncbi:MAG: protein kinase [Vulcanimicrobiota bacterium]
MAAAQGVKERSCEISEIRINNIVKNTDATIIEGFSPGNVSRHNAWSPGDVILDTYEVKEVFDAGAFGRVYRVHHRNWKIDLAMKSLRAEHVKNSAVRESFAAECQGWVNLGLHPHIVSCCYVREIEGLPCIFAEFMEGGSLDDWISEDRVPELPAIVDLSLQCLDGLAFAHDMGLVHRDLKPANCLLRLPWTLKITDFGIASGLSTLGAIGEMTPGRESSVKTVALDGGIVGTPAYMPPEQWDRSLGAIGPWTDIYAFGVMLFELCCGERPFDEGGDECSVIMMRHLNVPPPYPGDLNSNIPDALSRFIVKCLAKKPEERFRSSEDARGELVMVYGQIAGEPYLRSMPGSVQFRADSLNNRAVSSLDLGDEYGARALWQEALKIDYLHPRSTYNLGLLRWRRGEIDDIQLLEMLENIRRELPDSQEVDYFTGLVNLERDDCSGALEALERARALNGDNPDILRAIEEAGKGLPGFSRLTGTIDMSFYGRARELIPGRDQKTVFAWCTDRSVKTLDIESGQWLSSVQSDWEITSVTISSDEKSVMINRNDGVCRVMDLTTGAKKYEIARYCRHPKGIVSVSMSPDEKWAATGGNDNIIILWELESGSVSRRFEGHGSPVIEVRFSGDLRYLMSAEKNGYFKIWDIEQGECIRTFGNGTLAEKARYDSGERLLFTFGEGVAEVWDVPHSRLIRSLRFPDKDDALSISFSACGRWIVTGSRKDMGLKLWNDAGRCVRTFSGHSDYVSSTLLGSDAAFALSAQSGKIMHWQIVPEAFREKAEFSLSFIKTPEESARVQERFRKLTADAQESCRKEDWKEALELLSDLRSLPGYERAPEVSSLRHSLYSRFEKTGLRSIWPVKTLEGCENRMRTVLGSCATVMATALRNRESDTYTIELYSCSSGLCAKTFEGDWRFLSVLGLSCDGRKLAAGDGDGAVFIINTASGSCIRPAESHKGQVHCIAISADCRLMATGSADSTVRLWDIDSGNCLRVLEGHGRVVGHLQFCSDNQLLVSASSDKTMRIWDVSTGACAVIDASSYIEALCLCADGAVLYTAGLGTGRTLEAWDPRSGKHVRSLGEIEGQMKTLSISPDDRWACVTGSAYVDNRFTHLIHIWDMIKGECIRTIQREGDLNNSIVSVQWSPDGGSLVMAGLNASLTEWMLDWDLR